MKLKLLTEDELKKPSIKIEADKIISEKISGIPKTSETESIISNIKEEVYQEYGLSYADLDFINKTQKQVMIKYTIVHSISCFITYYLLGVMGMSLMSKRILFGSVIAIVTTIFTILYAKYINKEFEEKYGDFFNFKFKKTK